jgi:hypothetical protein
MDCVSRIGLHPIPEGRCSFGGATTSQRIPAAFNDRDSPNPVGLAS